MNNVPNFNLILIHEVSQGIASNRSNVINHFVEAAFNSIRRVSIEFDRLVTIPAAGKRCVAERFVALTGKLLYSIIKMARQGLHLALRENLSIINQHEADGIIIEVTLDDERIGEVVLHHLRLSSDVWTGGDQKGIITMI
ncbi:hypothetical protein Trco_006929 [Trichoderma cornu-damae]|uniref:Uncharacterized protein n=1 Tax=Trichoderma cornu-damae TaxID=654480 RepID=A0A9P8QMH5_9HYPO|nr:hypothetical protein Trco_006929 [Trichoderma cornu-damae]